MVKSTRLLLALFLVGALSSSKVMWSVNAKEEKSAPAAPAPAAPAPASTPAPASASTPASTAAAAPAPASAPASAKAPADPTWGTRAKNGATSVGNAFVWPTSKLMDACNHDTYGLSCKIATMVLISGLLYNNEQVQKHVVRRVKDIVRKVLGLYEDEDDAEEAAVRHASVCLK